MHIYTILACWDTAIKKTMIPMIALKQFIDCKEQLSTCIGTRFDKRFFQERIKVPFCIVTV